ncbi:MAG: N-acetyltransferase [Bacteroidales bacterium]|nr:MAG: N-acetyltransferase [Bacteroidales bacterium]
MELHILHNKSEILEFLLSSPELQVYSIGDLDNFFWPKTIWYSLKDGDEIKSIVLLYVGMSTPTLLAIYDKDFESTYQLLQRVKSILPAKFYAHLSPKLIDVFGKQNIIESYGPHYKMAIKRTPPLIIDDNIKRLSVNDIPIINEFYAIAYPDNWFDKRMLETQKYFGYFIDHTLVGIAGIHVYSEEFKVAALGNIATLPEFRGKQIGYKLTSHLCLDLKASVNYIGLNVKSDNIAAISCYRKVGFEIVGTYDEYLIDNK